MAALQIRDQTEAGRSREKDLAGGRGWGELTRPLNPSVAHPVALDSAFRAKARLLISGSLSEQSQRPLGLLTERGN